MVLIIDIIKNNKNFHITKKLCREIFLLVLRYLRIEKKCFIEFSITFDDDIQKLNKIHRKIDKPTNVLTFSLYKNKKELYRALKILPSVALGDIYFSYNIIKKEAKEQGKTFYNHFVHLLIHSYLHLLTFDHLTEKEQNEMEEIEIKILKKIKIDNPY